MRYNINDEISRKLVELELKNRKDMLTMFDGIIETLEKFDGKPITKRIETALRKNVSENIRVTREYNSFIIEYYFSDRYINYKKEDEEYTSCAYLKNSIENFVYACCHSSYNDSVNDSVLDYGDTKETLNFKQLKIQLLKQKDYIEKSIKEIEISLENVDELIREYDELLTRCKEFNHKKNWCVSEYFDIKDINNY